MLTDRREILTRRRVSIVNNTLKVMLGELIHDQAKVDVTTGQAKALLASVRPRGFLRSEGVVNARRTY